MVVKINDLPVNVFIPDTPEIYQIEVSRKCNLSCSMCARSFFHREDETEFIDLALIDKLIRERSFENSYFVELQMSGEPTLHPQLDKIINKLKPFVALGLSTNGTNLDLDCLFELDYVTINYNAIKNDPTAIDRIRRFVQRAYRYGKPAIDLQIIELSDWDLDYEILNAEFKHELVLPMFNIRTVPDCFMTIFDKPDRLPVEKELCLNPWLSVSIQANGNVVPCCFSFGDDIVYGNIKELSLYEIWSVYNDEVVKLREEHRAGNYRNICARCYMRSPMLLHWAIFRDSIRRFV